MKPSYSVARLLGYIPGELNPLWDNMVIEKRWKRSWHFENDTLKLRSYLKEEWWLKVLRNPEEVREQETGRVRHWGFVPELDSYLRVVTEGDEILTAYPDRNYTRKKRREADED